MMNNENTKEAILVMGGMIQKNKNGEWQTSNLDVKDNFGIVGDRIRVVAASYLHKSNPGILIIISGGKGQLKNIKGVPNISDIIKRELVTLGVPAKKIIKESNSGNTYQQLRELIKIVKEKGLKHVTIISNQYHLPRIRAMIETDLQLKKMFEAIDIKLVAAEKIVLDHDQGRWRKIITAVYTSELMKKRIALEKRGVRDIREGKYRF